MVDFNDGNTIGTPASDIVRVLILEKRTNVIEALESLAKNSREDIYSLRMVRARLQSLYWELEGMLTRKSSGKNASVDLKEIKELLFGEDKPTISSLIDCFSKINMLLDGIKLTRIDNHVVIDTRYVENDNERFNV